MSRVPADGASRLGRAVALTSMATTLSCGASVAGPAAADLPRPALTVPIVARGPTVHVERLAVAWDGLLGGHFELHPGARLLLERRIDDARPSRECAAFPPSPDGFVDSDERTGCQAAHPPIDECRAMVVSRDGDRSDPRSCDFELPQLDRNRDPNVQLEYFHGAWPGPFVALAELGGRSLDEVDAQQKAAIEGMPSGPSIEIFHVLFARDGARWRQLDALPTVGNLDFFVGAGEWTEGRVIAPLFPHADDPHGTPLPAKFVVLHGDASPAGMPVLPPRPTEAEPAEFASLPTGDAMLTWSSRGDGMLVWRWVAGSATPIVDTLPGVSAAGLDFVYPHAVMTSGDDIWLGVHVRGGGGVGGARILHFDGHAWTPSKSWVRPDDFSDVSVTHVTRGPDGAVWVALRGHRNAMGGIWRRRPGPGDEWDPIAPASLTDDGSADLAAIMPVGHTDLMVVEARYVDGVRTGDRLHRVHAE